MLGQVVGSDTGSGAAISTLLLRCFGKSGGRVRLGHCFRQKLGFTLDSVHAPRNGSLQSSWLTQTLTPAPEQGEGSQLKAPHRQMASK